MDSVMKRPVFAVMNMVAVLILTGGIAQAQIASTTTPSDGRRLFVVAGGGSTTLLGDCTGCPADTYTHSGGIFGGVGTSLTTRTAVGFEVFWMPSEAATGDQVRTTYLMGTIVFQPWRSSGFFVKAATGMALVRNWVVNPDTGEQVWQPAEGGPALSVEDWEAGAAEGEAPDAATAESGTEREAEGAAGANGEAGGDAEAGAGPEAEAGAGVEAETGSEASAGVEAEVLDALLALAARGQDGQVDVAVGEVDRLPLLVGLAAGHLVHAEGGGVELRQLGRVVAEDRDVADLGSHDVLPFALSYPGVARQGVLAPVPGLLSPVPLPRPHRPRGASPRAPLLAPLRRGPSAGRARDAPET